MCAHWDEEQIKNPHDLQVCLHCTDKRFGFKTGQEVPSTKQSWPKLAPPITDSLLSMLPLP